MKTALVLLLLLVGAASAGEGPRPVADLLADLDSSSYQVRRKAVLAVEGRSEPELLDKVLAMAAGDPHPNIRSYCADVLGTFTDARIHAALVSMTGDKWPGPRSCALVALGRQGRPESYAILIHGLKDESCRGYAAKGLGLLGDVRAWEAILDVWSANPKDGYLVDLAPRALLALHQERAIAHFLGIFETHGAGRYSLVRILREHPSAAIRDKMTGFLDATDQDLRHSAIRVLGKAGDEKTIDMLIAALGKRDEDSLMLARTLAEMGARRAALPVCELLSKAEDAVAKVTLIGALADLGDPRALAAIAEHLQDSTHSRQPPQISSVWQFPHNVVVGSAALWAGLTLKDGREPWDRDSMCSFPNPPSMTPNVEERREFEKWWEKHREDPRYRFE